MVLIHTQHTEGRTIGHTHTTPEGDQERGGLRVGLVGFGRFCVLLMYARMGSSLDIHCFLYPMSTHTYPTARVHAHISTQTWSHTHTTYVHTLHDVTHIMMTHSTLHNLNGYTASRRSSVITKPSRPTPPSTARRSRPWTTTQRGDCGRSRKVWTVRRGQCGKGWTGLR